MTVSASPAPIKPAVTDVERSDKLVKLAVDFGDHQRQILVGMKEERTDPGEITGLQALFVVNLEPRAMAGEISEGMLFDIGYQDGSERVAHNVAEVSR